MDKKLFITNHLDGWASSGLTQKAYCQQHKLSYTTFGYWRTRQLRKPHQGEMKRTGFLPITFNSKELPSYELVYPSGVRLLVSNGISLHQLKGLVNL